MQRAIQIQPPQSTFQKGGIKPVFALYSQRRGAPVSVPIAPGATSIFNVTQTTLRQPNGEFKKVFDDNGVINLLNNTAFSVQVTVLDPDKLDPHDISDLEFKWLRDGSYIHSINKLNGGKGFNVINFTADQVTQEITGNYTLQATNESGVTVFGPIRIVIHNRVMTPKLYGNLIANGSGEKGIEDWDTQNNITVSEFAPGILESKNFASINIEPTLIKQNDEFITTQPELPFRFCSSTNWINFNQFYQSWKAGNPLPPDYNWWYTYVKPNLVCNEDPGDEFACFFPSKRYMDEYNANEGKLGLLHEMKEAKTYFTKGPVERDSDPISKMTQEIDVVDIAPHIDGKTCGIDSVVGNFFAYVGLGISSYKFIAKFQTLYARGPKDDILFRSVNDNFWPKRDFFNTLRKATSQYGDIGNTVANRAGETDPASAFVYPIMRSLYRGTLPISGLPPANDTFKNLFNFLLVSDHPSVKDLPGFGRRFTNNLDYNFYNRNGNRMPELRSDIILRIRAVESLIVTEVIQPLNQYYNLDLNANYADLLKTDKRSFEILRLLVLLLSSVSISDIQGSQPLGLLISPQSSYQEARDTTYNYFKAVNGRVGFDIDNQDTGIRYGERFNFAYAILQFLTYEQAGGVLADDVVARAAEADKVFNTLVLDFKGLKQMAEGGVGGIDPKYDLSLLQQLDVYPICSDTVDFEFTYYNDFNEIIGTDTFAGPNEDDIFAVKEKTYLSTILTKLFQKTTLLSDQNPYIPVTYKGKRKLFTLYKFAYGDGGGPGITLAQDFIRKAYPAEYSNNINSLNSFPTHDQGAAAFFGVNKKIIIPRETRRIGVTAVFNHKSIAWGLEADSGLDRYTEAEIQAEHVTDKLKFYRSGKPRVGLAHMKLSLYDNNFKRTALYPNYIVPRRHVWSELKSFMDTPQMEEFDRILYPTEGDWQNFAYIQPTRESLAAPIDNTIVRTKPNETPQPDVVAVTKR